MSDPDKSLPEIAEELLTCKYQMAKVYGMEIVSRDLRHRSGEAFAKGRDELANWYRTEADRLDNEAKSMRRRVHDPASDRIRELMDEITRRSES